MDTIFTLKEEGNPKINLDDLYERKKTRDLNTLSTYNKILGRIHNRINVVSRQHTSQQFCWFVVPEMIIGIPSYDHGACVAYCIDKLRDNGFVIKYTHPNLLLISWNHWVPSYVRNEINKKTGVVVDGYGQEVKTLEEKKNDETNVNDLLKNTNIPANTSAKKEYANIGSYKPTGIYNQDLMKRIEDKTTIRLNR